jgi:hypothetical protein
MKTYVIMVKVAPSGFIVAKFADMPNKNPPSLKQPPCKIELRHCHRQPVKEKQFVNGNTTPSATAKPQPKDIKTKHAFTSGRSV